MKKLILVLFLCMNVSLQAFVPTSNFALDQSVAQNNCLELGGLDILDSKNEQALCEIVVNSPACEDVDPINRRQCVPEAIVETNAAVEFISCLKGLWGSALEFLEFLGSVLDYIVDSEYRENANEALLDTLSSAKHFLAMEWSRSLDETDGMGPLHYARAAKHFSKTLSRIIFNMLQETYYSTQANYACLTPAARTEAICKFAATVIIPPAIVMAKIGKYLIKMAKKVPALNRRHYEVELNEKPLRDSTDVDDVENDVVSLRAESSPVTNYLDRLSLKAQRIIDENPNKTVAYTNYIVSNTERMLQKLGIPLERIDINTNGQQIGRIRVTREMLKNSSTPGSKKLLQGLDENKLDEIIISPYESLNLANESLRSRSLITSSDGLARIFRTTNPVADRSKRSVESIRKLASEYSDEDIAKVAKQLNEEGFAVRVIEREANDPKTKKTIKLKALQFNRFSADSNHPGVRRLESFRNADFRQKIIFYPNQLTRAAGSSARDTRTVSFNFKNLEELVQGGHTNTFPHEFRHARFEYNRSQGVESVYDYRIKHLEENGKLHKGNTYTNFFSMEEVYNHSQDIYKIAKNLRRDGNIKESIDTLKKKAITINNISSGFRQQNEMLNLNFMSSALPSQIKVLKNERGGIFVKVGEDNKLEILQDKNGILALNLTEGPIRHTLPIANKETQQMLRKFYRDIQRPEVANDKDALARETNKVLDIVKAKNQERRKLIRELNPKVTELRAALHKTDYSNASLDQIKELARQIAQASKGR